MIAWPALDGVEGSLAMFTIYEKPLDYPDHWVVRRWFVRRGETEPVMDVLPRLATSLEEARELVPPGLYREPRQDGDDGFIVETWF